MIIVWTLVLLLLASGAAGVLLFVGPVDSDIPQLVKAQGHATVCYDTVEAALARATASDQLLVLSIGYPTSPTVVPPAAWAAITRLGLRTFIEFPRALPTTAPHPPPLPLRRTLWERVVVTTDAFGPALPRLALLHLHKNATFVTADAPTPQLTFAKVAGYDRAVFGLPSATSPVLFVSAGPSPVLVATTRLSDVITRRFAPSRHWMQVWQYILDWLAQGRSPVSVTWRPRVQASFAADAPLPHRAETTALDRAVEWYRAAGLLPGPAYAAALHSAAGACPALAPTAAPPGDGQLGVLEGYTSDVRPGGAQPPSCSLRADCIAETGMAFAVRHAVLGRPADARTATNLLNYMWQHGDYQKPWTPKDAGAPGSTFGLLRWMQHGDPRETIWRDDSARVMLASIAASALLDSPVWQSSLVVAVLAQLRLTGRNGFGPTAGHFTEFQRNGWRSYYDRDWSGHSGVYSPHFQCYIWAVFLWAYHVSSFPPLLDRAERALRAMMDGYPGKWQPTSNGITMQRARMLLPLAWLVRVRDTPQHRQWLLQVISGLLSRQVPCGALQEEIWADGWGKRTRVPNNTDYGTFEAPLNQDNADPVSDFLYTNNFALLGLIEAAGALGAEGGAARAAADRLAAFLVRAQARAPGLPQVDGAFFRAFDHRLWEVWGSDADIGWGAWSVETGWTQSWITFGLGVRALNTTLWDLGLRLAGAKEDFAAWTPFFFPEAPSH